MNNKEYFIDVLPCGLKIIYVPKKGFQKKFVGIGTLYGGIDFNFVLDGETHETFPGIAHFIEHKLFEMPGGIDAFQTLTNLGANSNAYTAQDRTMYYFTTTSDLDKPLNILMDFVFTPYFDPKSVEREKGIIKSEIQMYQDYPDFKLEMALLRRLYTGSTLTFDVAGSFASVDETMSEDLLINYKAFYQCSNMAMVIVGDIDIEQVKGLVNANLATKNLEKHNVQRLSKVESSTTVTGTEVIYDNISQTKVSMGIKLPKPEKNYLEDFAYDAILSTTFGDSSRNYQEMLEMEAITNDFSYSIVTSKDYRYIMFQTETADADLFISELSKRLEKLYSDGLNKKDMEIYFHMMLGESISYFDDVFNVGEAVLQYSLYGLNFYDKVDFLSTLSTEQIIPYIEVIKNAPKTIVKMLKNESKS